MSYFISFWKNIFNYKGTASRKEYWYAQLSTIIIEILLYICCIIFSKTPDAVLAIFAYPLIFYPFIAIIPMLSLIVRRLHDSNHSGLLTILTLIPGLNIVLFFIIGFLQSNHINNKWIKEEQ